MAKVTKSNVFEELGFDAPESADLALRAYLMSEIRKFIKANDLTQMRAATFLVYQMVLDVKCRAGFVTVTGPVNTATIPQTSKFVHVSYKAMRPGPGPGVRR